MLASGHFPAVLRELPGDFVPDPGHPDNTPPSAVSGRISRHRVCTTYPYVPRSTGREQRVLLTFGRNQLGAGRN